MESLQSRTLRVLFALATIAAIVVWGESPRVSEASTNQALSVPAVLRLCSQARHHPGGFKLIVVSRRVWIHGYFVRVFWNGYPVVGESGDLYAEKIPTHGTLDRIARDGGVSVGVPSRQIPRGILTARWITVHGLLRCYAPMGVDLIADSWHPATG